MAAAMILPGPLLINIPDGMGGLALLTGGGDYTQCRVICITNSSLLHVVTLLGVPMHDIQTRHNTSSNV